MLRERSTYRDRITIDPEIMVGKPVVTGTRIPVEFVLKRLAQDLDLATLFAAYPRLTPEDVKACLAYAQALRLPVCPQEGGGRREAGDDG
jgi:uncharacterized protein (DUF433 family)